MSIVVEEELYRPDLVALCFRLEQTNIAADTAVTAELRYEPTKEITVYGFAFDVRKTGPSERGAAQAVISDPDAAAFPIVGHWQWDRTGRCQSVRYVMFPPDWRPRWGPDHPMTVAMKIFNTDPSNACDWVEARLILLIKER